MGLMVQPRVKTNSVTWKHPHSPTTKEKIKIGSSANKMATIFLDCDSLLLRDFHASKEIN
jgi:hypothetical protein